MSATGLDVFDKTLQSTHIWLDELRSGPSPPAPDGMNTGRNEA
jgi:hypothetical protein